MANKLESDFQRKLVKRLENAFPEGIVMKNDPTYIQGIPDLTLLYKNTFVAFECKRSLEELKRIRPNQDWYIDKINRNGGLAYFIYPENVEDVINDITRKLGANRSS